MDITAAQLILILLVVAVVVAFITHLLTRRSQQSMITTAVHQQALEQERACQQQIDDVRRTLNAEIAKLKHEIGEAHQELGALRKIVDIQQRTIDRYAGAQFPNEAGAVG